MPQLQTLRIDLIGRRDAGIQLTQMPVVTLPNLCLFRFRGLSTYLKTLAHWIITPRLENISVFFLWAIHSYPKSLEADKHSREPQV